MKNLAKRDPHAVVTSVHQLPTKNMAVTHRVRLSAVLDVFSHTVPRSISFKGALLGDSPLCWVSFAESIQADLLE